MYKAEITQCLDAKPDGKDRRLEMIYKIVDTEENYGQLYDYINLESELAAFRLRQLIDALGKKPKGELDLDKILGEHILVRVKHETYNGEPRAKAGSLLPLSDDEEDASDDEDLDEDADDGEAYEDMPVEALREECEERGLKKSGKKDVLIARLERDDEDDDDNDDDDDEETDTQGVPIEEEEDEEEDYAEWDLDDLKTELKDRGLKTAGKKSALVKRLEKDDESDEDPF